tara:strand:+ start:55 stop:435 length:381 start_codon:yes stop_codon:yes gene_type:complete
MANGNRFMELEVQNTSNKFMMNQSGAYSDPNYISTSNFSRVGEEMMAGYQQGYELGHAMYNSPDRVQLRADYDKAVKEGFEGSMREYRKGRRQAGTLPRQKRRAANKAKRQANKAKRKARRAARRN